MYHSCIPARTKFAAALLSWCYRVLGMHCESWSRLVVCRNKHWFVMKWGSLQMGWIAPKAVPWGGLQRSAGFRAVKTLRSDSALLCKWTWRTCCIASKVIPQMALAWFHWYFHGSVAAANASVCSCHARVTHKYQNWQASLTGSSSFLQVCLPCLAMRQLR